MARAPINGSTLRWARETMFIERDELARATGTGEGRTAEFEAGDARPACLAFATKWPSVGSSQSCGIIGGTYVRLCRMDSRTFARGRRLHAPICSHRKSPGMIPFPVRKAHCAI